ncbi:hypothetical protein CER18_09205 [Bartonella tribocorum]|uniref:Uncharacterized protein n=1 Tax=Bartonella tribocorum TaxID=85701 RepID=A0A2N9Y853_9HYPH|nr:hypothetical protein CER18_09205 [Bartonella tribocorum]
MFITVFKALRLIKAVVWLFIVFMRACFKRSILIMCFISKDHLTNEGVMINTFERNEKRL